jgi:hypothetical protein
MRIALALTMASLFPALQAQSREEILSAMKKASTFFVEKVANHGGYHYYYSDDLSYGRSEHAEGPTQIEVQRAATPIAGMAFLEAYAATRDRYYLEAAAKAAHALVEGQLCSGGWDYVIEFDPAKRARRHYRTDGNCPASNPAPATLDDNTTQGALRLLMRVDRELEFKDQAIHRAALYALDTLIEAQYPNGAWPQRFAGKPDASKHPVKKASYPETWSKKWPNADYRGHYTFNDNTIADCIDALLEAAVIYKNAGYRQAAERGGGFILLAQMPEPQPAWAQQYDAEMHPAWARQFEPPAVTGGESQGIIELLMVLYRETGDKRYLDAIGPALSWLEKSVLPGKNQLARFHELKTNRPLYITKGTQIQAKGLGSARIDGYEVSYDPGSIITHYSVLVSAARLPRLRKAYQALGQQRTARPERLHGLSPWSEEDREAGRGNTAEIIRGLDDRGAWMQEGVIGKADKVVSVFAAHDMVLTINDKPIAIKENDRIELFDGLRPPREKIISTATFAQNLQRLAAALR